MKQSLYVGVYTPTAIFASKKQVCVAYTKNDMPRFLTGFFEDDSEIKKTIMDAVIATQLDNFVKLLAILDSKTSQMPSEVVSMVEHIKNDMSQQSNDFAERFHQDLNFLLKEWLNK